MIGSRDVEIFQIIMVLGTDNPHIRKEIKAALQRLADERQRPVLCLCGDMDRTSVEAVRNIALQLKEFDKLSVLLDSSGGDIEDAYRMVLALREYATDMEVLVPRRAKSAATFFCLAANTIHMGRYGELGPLDPQMLDLSGSTEPVSALESFTALDQLLKYSLDSLDGIVRNLLHNAPLDIPYAIEHAQPLFAAIVSPLYSKVDLHELSEAGRILEISEEYARRVMERWGYPEMSKGMRRGIIRRLVWDYPTHGFVIDLTEAREEVGLNAERLSDESEAICQEIINHATIYIDIAFPKSQDAHEDLGGEPMSGNEEQNDGQENSGGTRNSERAGEER